MGASASKPSDSAHVEVKQCDKKKKSVVRYRLVPATEENFPRSSTAVEQSFDIFSQKFCREHPMTLFGDQGAGAENYAKELEAAKVAEAHGNSCLMVKLFNDFYASIFTATSRVATAAKGVCLPSLILREEHTTNDWTVVGYFGVRCGYDADGTLTEAGAIEYGVAQNGDFVELLQIVPQLAVQLMRETGGQLPSSLKVCYRNDDVRFQEVMDKIEAADGLEVSCDTSLEDLTVDQRTRLSRMIALRQLKRPPLAIKARVEGRASPDHVQFHNTQHLIKLIEEHWGQLKLVGSVEPLNHPSIPQTFVYRMRKQGHVIDRLASDMSSNRHLHLDAGNRTLTLYSTLCAKGVRDLAEHVDKPPRGEKQCLCGTCHGGGNCPLRNAITMLLRRISDGMKLEQDLQKDQERPEGSGKARPVTLHSWLMTGAWREPGALGALLPHLSDATMDVAITHARDGNNTCDWARRKLSAPLKDGEVTGSIEVPCEQLLVAFEHQASIRLSPPQSPGGSTTLRRRHNPYGWDDWIYKQSMPPASAG